MPTTAVRTFYLCLLTLSLAVVPRAAADFFVAHDGDDANPGSEAKPFATLSAARDAVHQRIAAGLKADVTVRISGGTYRISEPLVFGPEDGGNDRFKVTYTAKPGEKPVISGGKVIGGWKSNGKETWTTQLAKLKGGKWAPRELFVDGHRATRARHPNSGYLRIEQVGKDRRTNFRFAEGDLRAYRNLADIELVFLHDWAITRTPIKSIDETTRTLTVPRKIGGAASWAAIDCFEKHPRYYLENGPEFLDTPGEWCLDSTTGTLTYYPLPGQTIDSVEIIAPFARRLLVVRGDVEKKLPVRSLHFEGLCFEHAAWTPAEGIYWGRQACTYWSPQTIASGKSHEEADPAALQFSMTESCSFTAGLIAHVGGSGIWLERGCRNNRIAGTVVSDVGGNGIMVGEGLSRRVGNEPWWQTAPRQAARGNTVENNLVEHCGKELFGAVGIWMGLAAKTTIAHNEVRHLPYTGISIGWMWWTPKVRPRPRKTPCEETLVVDNHIHHVLQILSDGGGIYALGVQPDSALRGNLIHDIPTNAGRAESNGMFLDQGTGLFTIEENVIYNVARSPLRFHKGWENTVRNNILQVSPGVPLVRYNDTVESRIKLENNRVVEKIPSDILRQARRRAGPEKNLDGRIRP